jgi:hypothetical protein
MRRAVGLLSAHLGIPSVSSHLFGLLPGLSWCGSVKTGFSGGLLRPSAMPCGL